MSKPTRPVPSCKIQRFVGQNESGNYVVCQLVDFDKRCSGTFAPSLSPGADCLVVDPSRMGPSRTFL
eukprot:3251430-Amphidinium_carterae.1